MVHVALLRTAPLGPYDPGDGKAEARVDPRQDAPVAEDRRELVAAE